MGTNFDDEQLMACLLKFVCGMPIQCHQIPIVDLYGNKPSQLFDTTTTAVNYVLTPLKKKKAGNGKNVNRGIVGGGGSWKGIDNSKPVYGEKKEVIGFKKTFRFDEGIHVWNMKEYRLTDKTLAAVKRRQIRHEDFVVCRITRSSNSSHGVNNFVTSCDLDYHVPIQNQETAKSSAQYQFQENHDTAKSSAQYQFQENHENAKWSARETPCDQFQENQELGRCSAANVMTYDELGSFWNGKEYYISQVSNATQLISAEEECSVPSVSANDDIARYHIQLDAYSVSPNDDIARYHRQLDAYAATILELNDDIARYYRELNPLLVPYVSQDDDQCPLFSEDFYIGHTALWS